jgi:hypothetical protein
MRKRLYIPLLIRKEPRNNFPLRYLTKKTESNFILFFVKAYLDSFYEIEKNKNILIGKELSLNGYGIADLVIYLLPKENKKNEKKDKSKLITFEMKMKDWKKALSQATRYKYFSNQTIVVLPEEAKNSAIHNIDVFRNLNVGFWTFSKKNNRIYKVYTPRNRKPINKELNQKAIQILESKFKI